MTDDHESGAAAGVSGDSGVPVAPPDGSAWQRWRYFRSTRVSKWDRPKSPRDWRFFVGGFGKALIVTGLMMFGFVAYQLWGTGIETARSQNELQNEFEEIVADESITSSPITEPPDSSGPGTTLPGTGLPADTVPFETVAPDTTVPGATVPVSTPTGDADPIAQDIPRIERGHALALLEIPKMGKVGDDALVVVPGVTLEDLKKGPGHYPDTPLPGQLGNAAIAAHRTTWGEPFRNIDKLVPGDEIIVTMITGDRFVYEVDSFEIVQPSDYHVVSTQDPTVAELTLTSCHPAFSARERYIVHAFLKPAESAPVGVPTYYDLEANTPPSGGSGDEAAASTEDPTVTQPVESESSVASASESSDEGGAPILTEPATDNPDDAFSEGWFHDPAAWPQIALWGAALILIVIAIRRISRRYRHDSFGIAAGIVPFVICLYFFYQNVNRLLPPGL